MLRSAMPATTKPPANVNGERLSPPVGGSCTFVTVTAKLDVVVAPFASVVVHITVVVPIGNVAPLGGVQVTVTAPCWASVAVAM